MEQVVKKKLLAREIEQLENTSVATVLGGVAADITDLGLQRCPDVIICGWSCQDTCNGCDPRITTCGVTECLYVTVTDPAHMLTWDLECTTGAAAE